MSGAMTIAALVLVAAGKSQAQIIENCDLYDLGSYDSGTNQCDCVDHAHALVLDTIGPCVCDAGYIAASTSDPHSNQCIPSPAGVAIVNASENETIVDAGYCPSGFTPCAFTDAATYVNDIATHAIFVPIAQILPDAGGITDWTDASAYLWDWTYMDDLINVALQNGKSFSLAFVVGDQTLLNYEGTGLPSYEFSLPANFEAQCNPSGDALASCAPLFHWWKGGSVDKCYNAYVPMIWNPNVQQFWIQLANALHTHLLVANDSGLVPNDSLTLIHLPGLSIYDEELRLPTAVYPSTAPDANSEATCPMDPDGAVQMAASVIKESSYYTTYTGYGLGTNWDAASIVSGITNVAAAFAQVFPHRVIGLSMFDPGTGSTNLDFPDFIDDASVTGAGVGDLANQIVGSIVDAGVSASRLLVQSDDLASPNRSGTGWILPEVTALASAYAYELPGAGWSSTPLLIGWQTNKVGSGPANPNTFNKSTFTGAYCNTAGCIDWDGSTTTATYYLLMGEGADAGAIYLESFPADIVNDPYVSSFNAQAASY
jgi:hypothetical protein